MSITARTASAWFRLHGPRCRSSSKITSSRFHDFLASYASEYPHRQEPSPQPGSLAAFSDQQRGSAQTARHRIVIGWNPYLGRAWRRRSRSSQTTSARESRLCRPGWRRKVGFSCPQSCFCKFCRVTWANRIAARATHWFSAIRSGVGRFYISRRSSWRNRAHSISRPSSAPRVPRAGFGPHS